MLRTIHYISSWPTEKVKYDTKIINYSNFTSFRNLLSDVLGNKEEYEEIHKRNKYTPQQIKQSWIKNKKKTIKMWNNACRINAYMEFRADKEDVGYELNPLFYWDGFLEGCKSFFGVRVGDHLEIKKDRQKPLLLKEFISGEATFKKYQKEVGGRAALAAAVEAQNYKNFSIH